MERQEKLERVLEHLNRAEQLICEAVRTTGQDILQYFDPYYDPNAHPSRSHLSDITGIPPEQYYPPSNFQDDLLVDLASPSLEGLREFDPCYDPDAVPSRTHFADITGMPLYETVPLSQPPTRGLVNISPEQRPRGRKVCWAERNEALGIPSRQYQDEYYLYDENPLGEDLFSEERRPLMKPPAPCPSPSPPPSPKRPTRRRTGILPPMNVRERQISPSPEQTATSPSQGCPPNKRGYSPPSPAPDKGVSCLPQSPRGSGLRPPRAGVYSPPASGSGVTCPPQGPRSSGLRPPSRGVHSPPSPAPGRSGSCPPQGPGGSGLRPPSSGVHSPVIPVPGRGVSCPPQSPGGSDLRPPSRGVYSPSSLASGRGVSCPSQGPGGSGLRPPSKGAYSQSSPASGRGVSCPPQSPKGSGLRPPSSYVYPPPSPAPGRGVSCPPQSPRGFGLGPASRNVCLPPSPAPGIGVSFPPQGPSGSGLRPPSMREHLQPHSNGSPTTYPTPGTGPSGPSSPRYEGQMEEVAGPSEIKSVSPLCQTYTLPDMDEDWPEEDRIRAEYFLPPEITGRATMKRDECEVSTQQVPGTSNSAGRNVSDFMVGASSEIEEIEQRLRSIKERFMKC